MSGEFVLIGEAAVVLGIPESTLRRLCDDGAIQAQRVGRYRVFRRDALTDIARSFAASHSPAEPIAGISGRVRRPVQAAHPVC